MPFRYDFSVDRLFKCPQNPEVFDQYDITLIAEQMIVVEEIEVVLRGMAVAPIYQEFVASVLAHRFKCRATVNGSHHVNGREFKTVAEVHVKDLQAVEARAMFNVLERLIDHFGDPSNDCDELTEAQSIIDRISA